MRAVEGAVALDAVRPFVEQVAVRLRRCYEPHLRDEVTLAVQWTIGADGLARDLTLDAPGGALPDVRACMGEAIAGQRYVRVGVEGSARIEVLLAISPGTRPGADRR